jgi:UrcA family protein
LITQFARRRSFLHLPTHWSTTMPNRIAIAAVAAVSILALATPGAAQQTARVSERVRYGDLDLATAGGARAMFHRMQAAVSRACAQSHSPALPRAEAELAKCRSATLRSAVADLGSPLVAARYAQSNDRRQMAAAGR